MNAMGGLGLAVARHVSWVMADEPIEAIEALTKRIVEAILSDALPEDLCKLAEARAWLIWPNQPH
jgi:hypothetical protein